MKKLVFSTTLAASLFFSATPLSFADFSDVPASHANYSDIQFLLDKGVIEDGKKFGVNEIVTRTEVAVMIAKALELDSTQRNTIFKDVPKSNKNSGYIQSAVEAGIINGYGDETFKPNAKVTRGHMAAFISRAFDLPTGSATFKDVPKGHMSYDAVSQLAAANITTGYGDGTFKPNGNLTRAHISAFLARAIKYKGDQEQVIIPKPAPTPKPQPEPVITPAPKPEVKEVGKTPETAAMINETVSIHVNDSLYGEQKYDLTLLGFTDSLFALNLLKEENRFNDEPPVGMKYVLAKFKIKVHSLEKEPFKVNNWMFDAVSSSGVTYDSVAAVVPDPFDFTLFNGSEFEGWVCLIAKKDEHPKIVFEEGQDAETWFQFKVK